MSQAVPKQQGNNHKVCVVGSEHSGKTALLLNFLKKEFVELDDPTIEDSHHTKIKVGNVECTLDLKDTGGNTAYDNLHNSWFDWGDAFVVVFNVTDKFSFQAAEYYGKAILKRRNSKTFPMILVGTQADRANRKIEKSQALELSYNLGCNYVEASAKSGLNVNSIFHDLVAELRGMKKEIEILGELEEKKKKDKKFLPGFVNQLRKDKIEHQELDTMDQALSIVKDVERRKKLTSNVPKHKLAALRIKSEIGSVFGPKDSDEQDTQSIHEYLCGRSISTYPRKANGTREGDPICDQYGSVVYENRVIVAVADGCNWGPEPMMAAKNSVLMFCNYLKHHQKDITHAREVASGILRAYRVAHDKILDGRNEETLYSAGTTTMLSGMMVELEQPPLTEKDKAPNTNPPWAFICINLGDCKAFHISHKTGIVREITVGNRVNVLDARDPGGRLGPTLEGGEPDLKNLNVYYTPCDQDDIIVMMTDGVHDNLDPQNLGLTPKECDLNYDNWDADQIADPSKYQEIEKKKSDRQMQLLLSLTGLDKAKTSLKNIVESLLTHCLKVNKAAGDFMQQNPNKPLPKDYRLYPGKMDHATVVAFKAGYKQNLGENSKKVHASFESPQKPVSPPVSPSPDSQKNVNSPVVGQEHVQIPPKISFLSQVLSASKKSLVTKPAVPPRTDTASTLPVPISAQTNSSGSTTPTSTSPPATNTTVSVSPKGNVSPVTIPIQPNAKKQEVWEQYKTETGEQYWYNITTGESSWEDPRFRNSEWKVYTDSDGTVYYVNSKTDERTWTEPPEITKLKAKWRFEAATRQLSFYDPS